MFQFQNVAINRAEDTLFEVQEVRFNSKMVQLIVSLLMILSLTTYSFQFQNGAINSFGFIFQYFRSAKFQFQNGAINRKRIYHRQICKKSFNSKMVQLIAEAGAGNPKTLDVSIPKWCN